MMPAKVAFICFYFVVKYFPMRAVVKYKQTQLIKIISNIFLLPSID